MQKANRGADHRGARGSASRRQSRPSVLQLRGERRRLLRREGEVRADSNQWCYWFWRKASRRGRCEEPFPLSGAALP